MLKNVLADHPELFWYSGSASLVKKSSGLSVTVDFTPEVFITDDEITARTEKMEERAREILSLCSEEDTLYNRLLLLHDILVDETDYDSDSANILLSAGSQPDDGISQSSSAYGCLVNRRAVCSGYAAAFQLLAGRLGAECRRVQGTELPDGAPHEWNLLCLDGKWYHVDVTWDDPVFTGETLDRYRTYDYFCVTTEEMSRTHAFDDPDSLPPCTYAGYGYYSRMGWTLDGYDFDEIVRIARKQEGNDVIFLKFPDRETAEEAYGLLCDGGLFELPGIDGRAGKVWHSITKMGTVKIWLES